MDPEAVVQRLNVALAFFPEQARLGLLEVLSMPDDDRIQEIGRVYREGRHPGLAELFMDLEATPTARRRVVAQLRAIILREN